MKRLPYWDNEDLIDYIKEHYPKRGTRILPELHREFLDIEGLDERRLRQKARDLGLRIDGRVNWTPTMDEMLRSNQDLKLRAQGVSQRQIGQRRAYLAKRDRG